MKIECAVLCHKGLVRENNEDNFAFNGFHLEASSREIPCFRADVFSGSNAAFGVFDGMGGEWGGEEASLVAAKTLVELQYSLTKTTNPSEELRRTVMISNERICNLSDASGGRRIGSTMTAWVLHPEGVWWANLGDSRIYLLRSGRLMRLSKDHTEGQRMLDIGSITEEALRTRPERNRLTQHLGIREAEMLIEPEIGRISVKNADVFLLCSDGVTDLISDACIERIMQSWIRPEAISKALMQEILSSGAKDNFTILILRCNKEWFDIFTRRSRRV